MFGFWIVCFSTQTMYCLCTGRNHWNTPPYQVWTLNGLVFKYVLNLDVQYSSSLCIHDLVRKTKPFEYQTIQIGTLNVWYLNVFPLFYDFVCKPRLGPIFLHFGAQNFVSTPNKTLFLWLLLAFRVYSLFWCRLGRAMNGE